VKAEGRLLAVVGAVLALLALAAPAGAAAARGGAHPRHVQVIEPRAAASLLLGTHGGYKVGVLFQEPDDAQLIVTKLDLSRLASEETRYGAHFRGSLRGGRVTADFGKVGSLSVRFHPRGRAREERPIKGCEGRPGRNEAGRWVGRVSLRGEGGYFAVSAGSAKGEVDRRPRLRCHFKQAVKLPPPESLREQIEPHVGSSITSILLGTVSSLEAVDTEGGRVVALRAAHASGTGPGAEVEAGAFEYQGRMPVGRTVQVLKAPAGSLVTSLPGERPATATLKPGAPFSGEAEYLASSPAAHSWTGTLAVRFPGLTVPLAGESFSSTLCVVSTLVKPEGCEYQAPDWQGAEEATSAEGRR
jgi:hypothetical protein